MAGPMLAQHNTHLGSLATQELQILHSQPATMMTVSTTPTTVSLTTIGNPLECYPSLVLPSISQLLLNTSNGSTPMPTKQSTLDPDLAPTGLPPTNFSLI